MVHGDQNVEKNDSVVGDEVYGLESSVIVFI